MLTLEALLLDAVLPVQRPAGVRERVSIGDDAVA